MLLQRIRLSGILSFGPGREWPLGPLNVLIGPNGCGKSNFIDILGLLKAAPSDIHLAFRESGGVDEWLWKKGAHKFKFAAVSVALKSPDDNGLEYQIGFTSLKQRCGIVQELLFSRTHSDAGQSSLHADDKIYYSRIKDERRAILRPQGGKPDQKRRDLRVELESHQSVLALRKDPDHYPEITYVGKQFSKMQFYRSWTFGRDAVPRSPQRTDLPNRYLEEDGSNLGLVLNRLARSYEVKRKLVGALRNLYDGISDFHVNVDSGTVQVYLQEDTISIPATRLSDGTLRYLCLLAILCDPEPPPVICLEEPELGLHPDVLPGLVDLMREASSRCQLVVTTHSDTLIDALSDTPESVVVCEKDDEGTQLKRLEGETLAAWLAQYRLGELWSSGEIGGNRW